MSSFGQINSISGLRLLLHLGVLFLSISAAASVSGQMMPQDIAGSQASQSPSSLDCSDPLMAGSADCGNQQNLNSVYPNGTGQRNLNMMNMYGYGYGGQARDLSGNYSDIEQLNRRQSATPNLPIPPEPLTEFQKFVASTTNQVLPVYGASLFTSVPSTFAPLDLTPVPADYPVGPGDELRIRIWGQLNLTFNVRVDRSGDVFLPQIGQVHVQGIPASGLDAQFRSAIGRVYHNFDLTVSVGQVRAIQIYISGQARRPGMYTISSLSTLVDALFASGGPSMQGSLRHVILRRGGTEVTDFDLYGLLIKGDKSKDVALQSGDVIFIPTVGPQVAVVGSVRNPAIYELRGNETLGELLTEAGGPSAVASQSRVSIERVDDHRDRHAMEVAYDSPGLATPMAEGDIVRIYSMVPIYRKTVILRGNISNPGRFAWHEGMRVSELIPDKESLITRDYWWRRSQLGLPAPEFEPVPAFADQNQPLNNRPTAVRPQAPPRQQETTTTTAVAQQPNQPSSGNAATKASIAATQNQATTERVVPTQRTEIRSLAAEIDWNYAVIERLDPETLKTKLIPFDLGKLVLQHDASQDLELQAGDTVSILSEDDIRVPIAQQTKIVRLDGEVVHAGVYTAQPGETLRQLVQRAGGLTPNAYLYGSEFTRVSTRAIQQARIDEYVQNLSFNIQRSNMALAVSSVGAGAASAENNEQNLITALRQLKATGRIVLEIKPGDTALEALPNLTLEDGDHFSVPSVPSNVNVVGAVYDQNSFLYKSTRRSGQYLQLAGGANRNSDQKHSFIIRANGEVLSRDNSTGFWKGDFAKVRMYPGDTIVVPEKMLKIPTLRTVMEWSQLFSQLALTAAALHSIQ